ncbi:MAG TPA: substrate-binding domain-containing protein [Gemmatimonadaceae bacterium]|nr:substrate-binding domain-containing protein [Gemmatimonadaceae bacterium]
MAALVAALVAAVACLTSTVAGQGADSLAPRPSSPAPRTLRVCSDPNNMPFSDRSGEGFENEIAALLARDLGRRVEYTWRPQRRGFVRNTLNAGECDLVMGVPSGYDLVRATVPYYRSTYVFVYRRDRGLHVRSLDDSALRRVRVGVHLIGDDYQNTPPAQALALRGIIDNVKGYTIYGDYSKPNPPADIIRAVAKGEIDVAIVWGPFGGYFASREGVPLEVVPVTPDPDPSGLPFAFSIAMGVRKSDDALAAELNRLLRSDAPAIRAILERYGVPLVDVAAAPGPQRESMNHQQR